MLHNRPYNTQYYQRILLHCYYKCQSWLGQPQNIRLFDNNIQDRIKRRQQKLKPRGFPHKKSLHKFLFLIIFRNTIIENNYLLCNLYSLYMLLDVILLDNKLIFVSRAYTHSIFHCFNITTWTYTNSFP